MITPGPGGYGLGWRTGSDPDGNPMHHHGGSIRGFVADMRRYPGIDGAIFVLANQDDSLPMSLVRSGVERILFGQPPGIEIPEAPSQNVSRQIEGDYFDTKGRRLTVQSNCELPSIKIHWGGPVTTGVIGVDEKGIQHLYMIIPNKGSIRFKADTRLEFGTGSKAKSISLLGLSPTLVFERRVNGR